MAKIKSLIRRWQLNWNGFQFYVFPQQQEFQNRTQTFLTCKRMRQYRYMLVLVGTEWLIGSGLYMGWEKFGMGRDGINPDGEGMGSGLKVIGMGWDRDRNRREVGLGLFPKFPVFYSRMFPVFFPNFSRLFSRIFPGLKLENGKGKKRDWSRGDWSLIQPWF